MSQIAIRAWREPAVFIGLATTVALVVITLATGDKWDTATIAGVVAPLASALGIRGFVSPATEPVAAVTTDPPTQGKA